LIWAQDKIEMNVYITIIKAIKPLNMISHTTSGYMLYAREVKPAVTTLISLCGDAATINAAQVTIGNLLLQNWRSLSSEKQNEWHSIALKEYRAQCAEVGFIRAHDLWEKELRSLTLIEGVMSGIRAEATLRWDSMEDDDVDMPIVNQVLELQSLVQGS
jgi:hypothetical protein